MKHHPFLRLYCTSGKRRTGARKAKPSYRQSVLALYFRVGTDWPSGSMNRAGHGYQNLIASAPETPEAVKYLKPKSRAHSLSYTGFGKQNESGFVEDLRTLGYDEETIARFRAAAKPYWPCAIALEAKTP